jgi:DedD protein
VLSLLKRKDSPAAAMASDESESVQAARTRARRRLIGAAVLLGVGIIGFPLLFETQPRPIAVDIPIEIPSRDAVPPLKPPPPKMAASTPQRAPVAEITETETAPPAAAASAVAARSPAAAASAAPAATAAAVAVAPAAPAAVQRDAERAQALLEGRPAPAGAETAASAAKPSRFVVQAGAYTDAATLREARQKVEKLGLKTYTQVIEANGSARTRVRVGPFESRDEAETAAARIKAAGLAVSILSL